MKSYISRKLPLATRMTAPMRDRWFSELSMERRRGCLHDRRLEEATVCHQRAKVASAMSLCESSDARAVATAATIVVVVASKFTEVAWLTVFILPWLVIFFRWIRDREAKLTSRRHWPRVARPAPASWRRIRP